MSLSHAPKSFAFHFRAAPIVKGRRRGKGGERGEGRGGEGGRESDEVRGGWRGGQSYIRHGFL